MMFNRFQIHSQHSAHYQLRMSLVRELEAPVSGNEQRAMLVVRVDPPNCKRERPRKPTDNPCLQEPIEPECGDPF